jgi:hypothetical protein
LPAASAERGSKVNVIEVPGTDDADDALRLLLDEAAVDLDWPHPAFKLVERAQQILGPCESLERFGETDRPMPIILAQSGRDILHVFPG